jgi:prepilin peptidase CpaA
MTPLLGTFALGVVGLLALAAVVCDVRTRRVPNALTFGAAGLALAYAGVSGGWPALAQSLAGLLIGLALFLPIFALGGMGAGDVKLLGSIGAWVGPSAVVSVALYGSIAGGVLAVGVALAHGYLGRALRNLWMALAIWRVSGVQPIPGVTLGDASGPRLPYAIPIAAGLAVTIWLAAGA